MRGRSYLDLTSQELRARRIAFFGLALFVLAPLLAACHLEQNFCQAAWRAGISSLVSLWPVFPWMLSVGLVMLCGLGLAVIGGILLVLARPTTVTR